MPADLGSESDKESMRLVLGVLLSLAILGSVSLAQDFIRWNEAANYYGQLKTVEGTVIATKNTGKVCFLNFSQAWRTDFTAVIFASDFQKFPKDPEIYYRNKKMRVTGKIQEYKGKPEIIVRSPSQIEIMEGNTGAPLDIQTTPVSDRPGASMQSRQSTNTRCQVITRKGTQCSRKATDGSPYCWQHQR